MQVHHWIIAAVCLVCFGCSQPVQQEKAPTKQSLEQGKSLYAALCAACHGKDARGNVGPDLTTTHFKYGKSHTAIELTITSGRQGGMPAFGSQLKKDEIASLADYILSLQ